MNFKVHRITVLDLERKDEALKLLTEVAAQVQPIMRARSWSVPQLSEANFAQASIQGMNHNGGELIQLRLRHVRAQTTFFSLQHCVGTMLHELCHIVHHNHSADFYALLDKLYAEWQQNIQKGLRGTGGGFDAAGHKLSSETHNPVSVEDAKRKALAAAQKRWERAELMSGGPRAVGGAVLDSDPKEAARVAALLRECQWCGNDGHTNEHFAQDKHVVSSSNAREPPRSDLHESRRDDQDTGRNSTTSNDRLKKARVSPPERASSSSVWNCAECTFENATSNVLCEVCSAVRPGFWICRCSFANSALFRCELCGAENPATRSNSIATESRTEAAQTNALQFGDGNDFVPGDVEPALQIALMESMGILQDNDVNSDENPVLVTDRNWIYCHPPNRSSMVFDERFVGKWMGFYSKDELPVVWKKVRDAVSSGRIPGVIGAKVATCMPTEYREWPKPLLVYTADYRNKDELGEVLKHLREVGMFGLLSYKTDEMTKNGQYAQDGPFTTVKAKSSLHSSKDFE